MSRQKLIPCFSFFLLFTIFPFSSLQAVELAPPGTVQRKLQRGLINTFLSPLEISHEWERVKGTDALVPTWLTGFGRGLWCAGIRAVVGIYEIVSAPIPSPPDYRPMQQPEFALQYLGFLKKDEAKDEV